METIAFTTTHIITRRDSEPVPVMLIDGAAYTRAEWDSCTAADFERDESGDWLFQGAPFIGTIETIRKAEWE